LNDAIYQNTPGNSQGSALGLSWDKDTTSTKTMAPGPSGWSGLTGWAQVYQEAGASVSPTNASDTVQVADFTTYVHLTNGTWVEVQNQPQDGIAGGHYIADFSTDAHSALTEQTLSDGSVSMDAPPSGYNDHFFPGIRGTFTAGTVDGVFVEANMKTNDPNANLVGQLGADWWQNATAQYSGLNASNTAVGVNDWTKLTTQWQSLYYTTLSAAQLAADPPPGLETTTTSGGTSSSGTTTGSTSGSTSSGSTTSGSTSSTSGGTTGTNPTSTGSSTGTSGSGTTTPKTPVAPTLTVADHALSVSPGGKVSLAIGVSVPHAGDNVSVNISGLPGYETITDNLDHKTFSGNSATLTAAEVNSGLSLSSSYRGQGAPTATLTVTAHDATGTPVTSAAQTITVQDPPATTTSSGSSTTTSGGGTSSGQWHHQWSNHQSTAVAATSSGTSTTASGTSSGQSPASRTNIAQWFNDHPGFAAAATTLSESGASKSGAVPNLANAATDPTSTAGAKAYALLNQMMAGDFGSNSHFAQAATALSASSQQQANLLTRPLH
jgi:hypothetical protein